MSTRSGLIAAAASICALLLTAGTAHAGLDPDQLRRTTDHYLYDTSLDDFAATRAEQPHADQLDWSSDSCSYSPDHPLGYDFAGSCDRHDFGYRNYQRQDRFGEPDRSHVDHNFKHDMYSRCGPDVACKATANVYFFAVREFGGSSRSTADALRKAHVTKAAPGPSALFRAVDHNGRTVTVGANG